MGVSIVTENHASAMSPPAPALLRQSSGLSTTTGGKFGTLPFNPSKLELPRPFSEYTFLSVDSKNKLYPMLCSYVAQNMHKEDRASFGASVTKASSGDDPLAKMRGNQIKGSTATLQLG